jgi:hypothetical protein
MGEALADIGSKGLGRDERHHRRGRNNRPCTLAANPELDRLAGGRADRRHLSVDAGRRDDEQRVERHHIHTGS